jgi:hypothetical protein
MKPSLGAGSGDVKGKKTKKREKIYKSKGKKNRGMRNMEGR